MLYIKFTNKQNLKKHVEAVHEGIKTFKCSVCDVEFANNYNPQIQEWYISSFANKQNLKKHVETVHEGIKPFKCSICDVKFAINYNPLIQERYILSLQINTI